MSKLILIITLIGLCLSTIPTYDCYSDFQNKLNSRCGYRGCEYFPARQVCTKRGDCSRGTSSNCASIIHYDYPDKKCKWEGSSCIETYATCSDYTPILEKKCEYYVPQTDKGDVCRFSYSNECTPHYNNCQDAPKEKCTSNIPFQVNKKCVLKNNNCETEDRTCGDTFQKPSKDYCESLKSSDDNKGCFFLEEENKETCTEYYVKCESYKGNDEATCRNIKVLKSSLTDFDKTKNCVYDSKESEKCQTKDIFCEDYDLGKEEEDICIKLKVKDGDTDKRCVYDYESKKCKEVYNECGAYNELSSTQKSKLSCEDIIPRGEKKICYLDTDNKCKERDRECSDYKSYEPEEEYCLKLLDVSTGKECKLNESKCYEKYIDCESYTEGDKKTCQSITPSQKGAKCILENDSRCISYLTCSQAKEKSECSMAKPEDNDSSKTCLFVDGECIENYKLCEYYTGYLKSDCENIIQENGYKCQFEEGFCQSFEKLCSEAISEKDCGAITRISQSGAITRISQSDKKVCEYDKSSGKCFENYKFCSDYTGTDPAICTNIKPYDPDNSNTKETAYKCVYEDENVGCDKKLLDCSVANGKNSLCTTISELLKTKSNYKKYCAYINDNCTEQYYTCENYDKDVEKKICESIIPNDYLQNHCVIKTENRVDKCVSEPNKCEDFEVDDYEYQCLEISPFCSYSDGICTQVEKNCSNITFLTAKSDNEDYCELIDLSSENKTCVLSDDQLKCEVKDIPSPSESSQSSSSNSSSTPAQSSSKSQETEEGSSSGFLESKKIELILIILCLLL